MLSEFGQLDQPDPLTLQAESQARRMGGGNHLAHFIGDGAGHTGAHAVVIGSSNIVGKPMAALLLKEHATVTQAHIHTRGIEAICRQADILVSAVGKAGLVRGDWIKPAAIVIDVGTTRVEKPEGGYAVRGDVSFDEAVEIAGAITPVPRGVGPMTIACLMENTVKAAKARDRAAAIKMRRATRDAARASFSAIVRECRSGSPLGKWWTVVGSHRATNSMSSLRKQGRQLYVPPVHRTVTTKYPTTCPSTLHYKVPCYIQLLTSAGVRWRNRQSRFSSRKERSRCACWRCWPVGKAMPMRSRARSLPRIGMGEGTIYPLMRRMQDDGLVDTRLVESTSGPPRQYYRLTPAGRAALAAQKREWQAFTGAVDSLLGGRK